jgi:GR25 family glycosyltransferase involved in LPS biosynthesis
MFWAYPKIVTYSQQNEPFIHIDLDALLWEKPSDEILNAPMVFQHKELFSIHKGYNQPLSKHKEFGNKAIKLSNIDYAYCCGFAGGNDIGFFKELRQKVDLYLNTSNFNRLGYNLQNHFFEQFFSASLAKERGQQDQVKFLCGQEIYKKGEPLIFAHLWGGSKKNRANIDKCIEKAKTKSEMNENIVGNEITIDKTYVINLSRRKDRWELVQKRLQAISVGLNSERLNAWDSDNFTVFKNQRLNPKNGACFMSHLIAISAANIAQLDIVGIMEDDVIFRHDFNEQYELFIQNLPSDWDIILLGAIHFEQPTKVNDHVLRCKNSIGSWSYIVKKTAFKRFIEIRLNCDNKNDIFTASLQKEMNVYCPEASLTAQDPRSDSDLKGMNYGEFIKNWKFKHDFDYELWQEKLKQGKVF